MPVIFRPASVSESPNRAPIVARLRVNKVDKVVKCWWDGAGERWHWWWVGNIQRSRRFGSWNCFWILLLRSDVVEDLPKQNLVLKQVRGNLIVFQVGRVIFLSVLLQSFEQQGRVDWLITRHRMPNAVSLNVRFGDIKCIVAGTDTGRWHWGTATPIRNRWWTTRSTTRSSRVSRTPVASPAFAASFSSCSLRKPRWATCGWLVISPAASAASTAVVVYFPRRCTFVLFTLALLDVRIDGQIFLQHFNDEVISGSTSSSIVITLIGGAASWWTSERHRSLAELVFVLPPETPRRARIRKLSFPNQKLFLVLTELLKVLLDLLDVLRLVLHAFRYKLSAGICHVSPRFAR